jgi:hypothetical protein
MVSFLKAIAKLVYYGTLSTALFLFATLCLIELAALWQWLKPC